VNAASTTGSGAGRRRRRRGEAALRTPPDLPGAGIDAVADARSSSPRNPATRRPAEAGTPSNPVPDEASAATDDPTPQRVQPAFAHASEAEMARILDFYQVRWEYEPHTFPILWNLDGAVVESFSPDFWLPDLGVYLEMTTLRQKLVRKKNRKLRRVLELYPDLRVKLFYARDFRALMLKYGKFALYGELSGTSGQVVPAREGEDSESGPTIEEAGP